MSEVTPHGFRELGLLPSRCRLCGWPLENCESYPAHRVPRRSLTDGRCFECAGMSSVRNEPEPVNMVVYGVIDGPPKKEGA